MTQRPRIWPALAVGAGLVPLTWLVVELVVLALKLGERTGLISIESGLDVESGAGLGLYFGISLGVEFLVLGVLVSLARRSSVLPRERFALGKGRFSLWQLPLMVMGTLAVQHISAPFIESFFANEGDYSAFLSQLMSAQGGASALLLWLTIAVLPPLTEELLFRGYVQVRLLKRWPAWLAIFTSSLFFAAAHGEWQYALQMFPVGLWFGYLALLTESVWPSIFCHFCNNALVLWVIRSAGSSNGPSSLKGGPEAPLQWVDALPPALFLAVILWILRRTQRRRVLVVLQQPMH